MDWHALEKEEVLRKLKSSEKGLDSKEVNKRFAQYGKNVIRKIKGKSQFRIFISQFNSLLVYILILAMGISWIIGHVIDATVIGIIVLLNAIIGFYQEYKAEEIIEKLKKSLRYKVMVIRNNTRQEISSKLLVPGDIVLFDSGDRILADCRIIESENLQINEAVLSGESFPIGKESGVLDKSAVLSDRKNMLYAGTTVSRGKVTAVVTGTGMNTEFGNLAELVQLTESEKTPLEEKINNFSKKISIAILFFVLVAYLIGIYMGIEKVEMFLVAVSLAIGAIPEGLPAIIAITLAVSIKQMYKVNTLVRKLPAAETLGRATVICTDKTGTLTEEELTVDKIYSGKMFRVEDLDEINSSIKKVLEVGILCNSARDEEKNILGDPTETALIRVGKKFGMDKKQMTEKNVKVKEFAFTSERKMMSIIREDGNIKTSYVKGAPLYILERCTRELVGGKIKLLDAKRRKELEKISRGMENGGLRVLGFAFRQLTIIDKKNAENYLTFVGYQGMIDPPREEIKEAISEAIKAGIKIKIITGDSAFTTLAIARKIGLDGEIIEGRELDKLSESKWDSVVRDKTIFARITPQQKLKVVEILRKHNEVVAVTGDGVNDILALKKADIGISMGIRGSDVARESSDVVLLDDNFASIVSAVKQGRRVYDNMKKSIKFLLAANIGEVLVVILSLILGFPLIFLPLAILWMNLVTDSLPALALAIEPAEKNVMMRRPQNKGLLSGIWQWILIAGFVMVLSCLFIFNYGLSNFDLNIAQTMAITTGIFFELFFAFSCKSNKSLFKTGIFNNWWLIGAVFVSAGLHLVLVYTFLGSIFGFVPLTGSQLGWSVLVGLSGLVVFEIGKLFGGIFRKKVDEE